MNEKIKQLMIEAGYAAPEIALRAQKLVEIVVKECAEQVDWVLADRGKTQGDVIKQHFGVKE